MQAPYHIPAETMRIEIEVARSRFIATAGKVTSVDQTKQVLSGIRAEMPDASHHVYAFRVGYGNSVTEGMSDDGEPTGTAGPPILAVVRGRDIGDVIVVVTRYFGGTKLGTGGLVRAYSEAAQTVLQKLKTELKIEKQSLSMEIPYNIYQRVRSLIESGQGVIIDEVFEGNVTITATFPVSSVPDFERTLRDASSGRVVIIPVAT